ncbi:hypothetical protein [Acidiplasma cupricumulans]|uniref:hypothetical protein n=1 Tax=Acidiplasma cupricumulans TaxID=312540 RepID=UPI000783EC9D|nr:hypothetical protein [Acidiplasma cupricumulans]
MELTFSLDEITSQKESAVPIIPIKRISEITPINSAFIYESNKYILFNENGSVTIPPIKSA